MGLFKIDYSRPGPGIAKDAPKKKGLRLFWDIYVRVFWELIKLNMLFFLFCIPIVTIGPAFAGMSRVMMLMVRERPFFVWGDFWEEFRASWKKSVPAGLLVLLCAGALLLAIAFYAGYAAASPIMYAPMVLSGVMLLLLGLAGVYVFPLLVSFEFSLVVILKNAFGLGIGCLKHSLPALLLAWIGLLAIVLYLPLSVPFLVFFYFSHVCFLCCFAAWPGICKYVALDPAQSNTKGD